MITIENIEFNDNWNSAKVSVSEPSFFASLAKQINSDFKAKREAIWWIPIDIAHDLAIGMEIEGYKIQTKQSDSPMFENHIAHSSGKYLQNEVVLK